MLYTWKIDFLTPATFVAFSPRDKYIRDQFLNVGIAGNSIAMFRYFFLAEFFPQISRKAFERARSIRLLTCWRRFEPNFIRLDEMRKGSTKQSFLSFFFLQQKVSKRLFIHHEEIPGAMATDREWAIFARFSCPHVSKKASKKLKLRETRVNRLLADPF